MIKCKKCGKYVKKKGLQEHQDTMHSDLPYGYAYPELNFKEEAKDGNN